MGKTVHHNWPEVRRDFVEGISQGEGKDLVWPTTTELAKRWKIPQAAVDAECAREGWVPARAAFRLVAEEQARRERFMDIARRSVAFDERAFTVANALLTFAQNRLALHATQGSVPPLKELRELAEVCVRAQHVGRLAVGESTENFRNLDKLPPFRFVIQGASSRVTQEKG